MNTLQAFHNDQAVKAKYQKRLTDHRAAEQLIQGIGFEDGKGCAVGCTLNEYDHSRYPIELGLPEWLAWLEDCVFEGLPKGEAEQFAEDFLAAIPVGANVDPVRGQLAILRHTHDLHRLESNTEPYAAEVRAAIQGVIDWINDGEKESAAWSAESAAARSARSARSAWSAESAAWSAARSAWSAWSARSARSAAESAAWSAARSAAWSAAWSAWSARSARSAARSAAWSAWSAWSASKFDHYRWEAATLLQLLRESV